MKLRWSENDQAIIREQRALALDVLNLSGSGHTGATLSLMPVLYILYSRFLRNDPANPNFPDRDRFVLSCGHASLAQYIQLFYFGYGLELEDLKKFRKIESRCPGHPEFGKTPGVEMTTGPLGQGFAASVGFAISSAIKQKHGNKPEGHKQKIYTLVSDGDLQEGISFEAANLAALYNLSNLIVLYDFNQITIDGPLQFSSCIDLLKYFDSLGWNTLLVRKLQDGEVDCENLISRLEESQRSSKPTLVIFESTIGYPAPQSKGKSSIHGSILSTEEYLTTKEILGFEQTENFKVSSFILKTLRESKSATSHDWTSSNRNQNFLPLDDLIARIEDMEFPEDISMREANGRFIEAFSQVYKRVIGGSADLTESNNLKLPDLIENSQENKSFNWLENRLLFGVREHAMAAVILGIATEPDNIAYCATYLVFSDYQKPAIRLAAMMGVPAIFLWTHDSIAIGADGPTHQPIEQLAMLRAIPNFAVCRPANTLELACIWKRALTERKPVGLVLSRQKLENVFKTFNHSEDVIKGAYIFFQNFVSGEPDVVIISTGSEVDLACKAGKHVELSNIKVRVVSMPCQLWYDQQSETYQRYVMGTDNTLKISLEAASTFGWERYTNSRKNCFGINSFGESGEADDVAAKFGFTIPVFVEFLKERLNEHKGVSS